MGAVQGLFGGSYTTVAEALTDAQARNCFDLPLLLKTWQLADGSADAARLCRCIRAAVQTETLKCGAAGNVGVTAEPVAQGWTASTWAQADELRLLRKDGSLIAALAQAGDSASSSSGRDCTSWRSVEFDGDEPLVGYCHPQPSTGDLPSMEDVASGRQQRAGGRGFFACCGNPTQSAGHKRGEPTSLTVVGSLRAAAEGPHGTTGPCIHAKPTARSAVLRSTTIGEELQATGEMRSQGSKRAEWVQVEWAEEQPLEAGGQFAGTVTVRATGWVLTQAEGVLFLERSLYYNARK